MSDDFHRPTLTFPTGAYNATQVRLYGIRSDTGLAAPNQPATFGDTGINIESDSAVGINKEELDIFRDIVDRNDPSEDLEGLINAINARIPGIPVTFTFHLKIETKKLGTISIAIRNPTSTIGEYRKQMTCGIIVGYSYEGHTYDLLKPKIMVLPVAPELFIPDDDSGYKLKEGEGYAVWIVDKLDECIEIDVSQGFIEQLVLEANLPGKRAPSMYAAKMMMGHRSGRLSE